MSASVDINESIQKSNQSGLFVNTDFGQEGGFENPEFYELDLITKAEVGPEPQTKELKVRRATRNGGTAETVNSVKWGAKADLVEYKLSQQTNEAKAFHHVKDASRKRPVPEMVDILHVEELDADYSYATRAVCIIKAGARNENEDEDVSTSYEFAPGVNAYLDSEFNGTVYNVNGVPQGFVPDTSSTSASWAVPL